MACSGSPTTAAGCVLPVALWNEADPILKERLFGLTGPEGNHGEDVKEAYFYLDNTPTHSYMRALYKYPAARLSLYRPRPGEPPPRQGPARIRAGRYGRLRRRPLLRRRGRVRQGRPDRPGHSPERHQPRSRAGAACTCCRRCGSATPGPGASRHPPDRPCTRPPPARSRPSTPNWVRTGSPARARPSCSSPRTRPTPSGCGACPIAPRT